MANPVVQMVIVLLEDGSVQVQGPLENRVLCYGLLSMANEAIFKHGNSGDKNRIVAPPPGMQVLKQP